MGQVYVASALLSLLETKRQAQLRQAIIMAGRIGNSHTYGGRDDLGIHGEREHLNGESKV